MSEAVKSLPVFQTVGDAIKYTIRNIGLMVQLVWFWALLIIVLAVAVSAFGGGYAPRFIFLGDRDPSFVWDSFDITAFIAIFVLYLIATCSVIVGWHRSLLLDERPGGLHASFGGREIHYILRMLMMSVLVALVVVALVAPLFALSAILQATVGGTSPLSKALPTVGAILGAIGVFLLSVRFMLIFPGAAVGDRRVTLRTSFSLTKGNSWRLLGGLILIGLIQAAISLLLLIVVIVVLFLTSGQGFTEWADAVSQPEQNGGIGLQQLLLSSVQFLFSLLFMFCSVSYVSYCYWFFVPPPEQGDLAR